MNKIDSIRKKECLSYGDISKATGLTAPYIHMLAKGKRENPSKETMEKIANALDRTVQEVFFDTARKAKVTA